MSPGLHAPRQLPDPFGLSCDVILSHEGGRRRVLECEVEERGESAAARHGAFRVELDEESSGFELFGMEISVSRFREEHGVLRLMLESPECRWEWISVRRPSRLSVDVFGYGPKLDGALMLNGEEIGRTSTPGRWSSPVCTFSSGRSCVLRVSEASDAGALLRNWSRLLTFRWRMLEAVSPLIAHSERDEALTATEAWSAVVAAFLMRLFCVNYDSE